MGVFREQTEVECQSFGGFKAVRQMGALDGAGNKGRDPPHPAFSLVKESWLQPAGVGRQQEVSNHYVVSVVEGKGKNKRAQVGKSLVKLH